MRKPYRLQTSVKQILVRDFNFRMGNIRRVYFSMWGISNDTKDQIQELLWKEMERQKVEHEKRLEAILPENIDSAETHMLMVEDLILSDAIRKAQQAEAYLDREIPT